MPVDAQKCCEIDGSAELGIVEEVLDAFDQLCEGSGGVADEDQMQFALAVSEILTNMITHGRAHPGAAEIAIHAKICVDPHQLQAFLRDTAEPINVALDNLSLPDDVLEESGRGLVISTMVLDRLERQTDSGNVWTLQRFRRP
ncbi:ATP-binding protein [Nesterenkonia haasae]|uniref:ATP-binding protein n=1 Tax=Nesterenkonia haasae TaxID=2587813 RepID=UPI00139156B8|nr:ATP-binding protein [Nesterenkonia haasae]NDK30474.1 ATP-binding protein [Nesterenkonia haasae]